MNKYALLLLMVAPMGNAADLGKISSTAVRIEFEKSVCSGTAVGKDLVLTAEHCFDGAGNLLTIGGREAKIVKFARDGNDHYLAKVDIEFKTWKDIGDPPKQGDDLEWIGNPAGMPNMYRRGYVSSVDRKATYVVAELWKGDSGSGLIGKNGRVVGVVSSVLMVSPSLNLLVANPMAFSSRQLKEMRK